MPMSQASRVGIFLPDEIEAMRREFDEGAVPNETPLDREHRAAALIARHQARKSQEQPPQP